MPNFRVFPSTGTRLEQCCSYLPALLTRFISSAWIVPVELQIQYSCRLSILHQHQEGEDALPGKVPARVQVLTKEDYTMKRWKTARLSAIATIFMVCTMMLSSGCATKKQMNEQEAMMNRSEAAANRAEESAMRAENAAEKTERMYEHGMKK